MEVDRFKVEDLEEIELQASQAYCRDYAFPERLKTLASSRAYTLRIDGRVIACAGIVEISEHEGQLWAWVSVHATRYMTTLHRCARRFLETAGKQYLAATTEIDFAAGCRWLEMLGFTRQPDVLARFGPDGRDHAFYILEN